MPDAAGQLASRPSQPTCPVLKSSKPASISGIPQGASRVRQSSVAKPVPAALASQSQAGALASSMLAQEALASSAQLAVSATSSPASQLARLASPRPNVVKSPPALHASPASKDETTFKLQQGKLQAVSPVKDNQAGIVCNRQLPVPDAQQQGRQATNRAKSATQPVSFSSSMPQSWQQSANPQGLPSSGHPKSSQRHQSPSKLAGSQSPAAALHLSPDAKASHSVTADLAASKQVSPPDLRAAIAVHAQQLVTDHSGAAQGNAAQSVAHADDVQQQAKLDQHAAAEEPEPTSPVLAQLLMPHEKSADHPDEAQPPHLVIAQQAATH